jgi:predicted TIM-barrel fold metal-dependent hydrolase
MDRDGVQASVMFPPIFGFAFSDRDMKVACIRAYNDWASDFAKAKPERLLPVAQFFPDDLEASVQEVYRAADLGFKQLSILVGSATAEMYQPEWEPFWSAAEETGLAVSYHVGGGGGLSLPTGGATEVEKPGQTKRAFGMGLGNGATSFYVQFVDLFTFGILERHPNLRFVLAESGTGWIPFVVQEMDYRVDQVLERRSPEGFPLKKKPSDVFREQVWATYQQDEVGLHLVDFFGEGHMMWASDYPHPDSTWPNSRAIVAKETTHLDEATRWQIIHENAKAFYGL